MHFLQEMVERVKTLEAEVQAKDALLAAKDNQRPVVVMHYYIH